MNNFIKLFEGKKSYVFAVLMAIFGVLKVFGLNTTPEQDTAIFGLLAALFGVSLSAKVNRLGKKLKGE